MPYTDQMIISMISNPDKREKGFRILVDQNKEKVYWVIRRMVSTHEDADDLVQEVFIKIYRNMDQFMGSSKLYTWIHRITVNETLSFLKRTAKTKRVSMPDSRIIEKEYLPSLNGERIQEVLSKAINTLPSKQKIVFNMRYFEEIKYDEMSKIMGTSVGALKASYHHAVKKIEGYIKQNVE